MRREPGEPSGIRKNCPNSDKVYRNRTLRPETGHLAPNRRREAEIEPRDPSRRQESDHALPGPLRPFPAAGRHGSGRHRCQFPTEAGGNGLSLVGESGCGKTTLARTLLRGYEATAGSAWFRTEEDHVVDLLKLPRRRLKPLRRQLQMVFQDPYSSLNPRMTVQQIIGEPLRIHAGELGIPTREGRRERVRELLLQVGAPARGGPALSARLQRRGEAADRHRANAGHPAPAGGGGRTGLSPGRLRPGPDPQPDVGTATAAPDRHPAPHSQPDGGPARQRPRRRHVPGADHGDGSHRDALHEPRTPVYGGPSRCDPPARSPGPQPAPNQIERRSSQPPTPTLRMSLPPPLYPRPGSMPHRAARAGANRPRAPGPMPPLAGVGLEGRRKLLIAKERCLERERATDPLFNLKLGA